MSQRILRNVLAVAAVALALSLAGDNRLLAQDQQKGSLSGTVVSAEGKPMVGMNVRLERTDPVGIGDGASGKRKNRSSGPDLGSGAVGLQSEGKQKGVKIVGKATTDQQGKFTIANVEPGAAILVGGSKNVGWIYYPVVVEPGKDTNIGEIKLAKE